MLLVRQNEVFHQHGNCIFSLLFELSLRPKTFIDRVSGNHISVNAACRLFMPLPEIMALTCEEVLRRSKLPQITELRPLFLLERPFRWAIPVIAEDEDHREDDNV